MAARTRPSSAPPGRARSRPSSAVQASTQGDSTIIRRQSEAHADHPLRREIFRQESGSLTVLAGCPRAPKYTIPGKWSGGKEPGQMAPGPGHYDLLLADEKSRTKGGLRFGPKAGSSGSDRIERHRPGPGPGSYNALGALPGHVPGGTIARGDVPADPAAAAKEKMPGPGDYDTARSTLDLQHCGAIICDDICVRRRDAESGPFNPPVEMAPLASRPEPPKFSFGRASRPSSAGSCRVIAGATSRRAAADTGTGPDMYMPPSTLGGGAACVKAGHAPPEKGRFEVRPDPTTYTPMKPTPAQPRQPFSRARRPVSAPPGGRSEVARGPGPGSYNSMLKDAGHAPRIGTAQRKPLYNTEAGQFPGPGSYSALSSLPGDTGGGPMAKSASSQAFTFGKAKRQASEGKPAPAGGALALWEAACLKSGTDGRQKDRSCLGGKGPRLPPRREPGCFGRNRRQPWSGPGPGAFSPQLVRGSSAPSLSIGKAPRFPKDKKAGGPGPGDYKVPCSVVADRGVSIAKAKKESAERRSASPGPGAYQVYACF
jgi:hypothetical protein